MELVFYILTLLGSSSLGYSLLRTAFPKTQSLGMMNKVLYGYALGAIVVVPAMVTALFFGATSFFLILGLMYALLFIIFIAKRISYNENDGVKLKKEEKVEVAIPRRILTKEEKEGRSNIIKKPIKAKQIIRNTPVAQIKIKEQIFKEKQPNVIAELREKTTKIEKEKKLNEKEEALKKMKSFAKQIDKKKKKKNSNEIDEDELSNLGEGF
ncbi:MAG: hypothetical protein HON47_00985 [Candidatus Diapherotrites archaeon]|uniref:Uncharacterized protein n=1 Tax=Candidatus Iainarchaeum sp. TaxID=3101447 RepID=A0A8T5GE77_9ARCH|nr:hypothetical protein [Candidatus Diapherotrites archaeon]